MTLRESLAQSLHDFGIDQMADCAEAADQVVETLPLFDIISDTFGALGEYREDEEIEAFVEALKR